MGGGWRNPDFGFDPQGAISGMGGFLGGLFGDSGKPYDDAMKQYEDWTNRAENAQRPYTQAGAGGVKDYQSWLKGQKDPSGFINNLMGQYSESPYAKYLQQQSMNAGQNMGSASGLSGSSALMQQMQQNAGNIASQDQNQWLQNVLGINTQYGQGQNNLIGYGANAANALTGMYDNMGGRAGEAAYGKAAGGQNDFWNTLGGLGSMAMAFL